MEVRGWIIIAAFIACILPSVSFAQQPPTAGDVGTAIRTNVSALSQAQILLSMIPDLVAQRDKLQQQVNELQEQIKALTDKKAAQ